MANKYLKLTDFPSGLRFPKATNQYEKELNDLLLSYFSSIEDALTNSEYITNILTPLTIGTAPDYVQFESDGTIVLNGAATVWDDINHSFASAKVPAANAPTWATFIGNIKAYTFAINDYVDMEPMEVLHGYKEGTDLEFHLHYVTNGLDATDRTVKFEIEYSYANMGNPTTTGVGSALPSTTVVSMEQTIPADTPDKTHMYTDIDDINGTGIAIGAIVAVRFKRIAASGTDPTSDPYCLMLGIHHEIDTLGSNTEYVK